MVANECEYCHQDLCIGKCVLGESFECKGMIKKDIVIECIAKNSDLVNGCIMCECREANAEFPYEEYANIIKNVLIIILIVILVIMEY